jgi:hypothetical protein
MGVTLHPAAWRLSRSKKVFHRREFGSELTFNRRIRPIALPKRPSFSNSISFSPSSPILRRVALCVVAVPDGRFCAGFGGAAPHIITEGEPRRLARGKTPGGRRSCRNVPGADLRWEIVC